jgi:hypothetical protein
MMRILPVCMNLQQYGDGLRVDNRTFSFEMFTPAVFSRIEQPHDSPGRRIDSRDIRALPDVAVQA